MVFLSSDHIDTLVQCSCHEQVSLQMATYKLSSSEEKNVLVEHIILDPQYMFDIQKCWSLKFRSPQNKDVYFSTQKAVKTFK